LAVDRKETSVCDSYPGATEGELLGAPPTRRPTAYNDQRRLFPHQGWFWFADGRFSQIVVSSQEKRESCRIRTVDAC
jgi:hypothetical protein